MHDYCDTSYICRSVKNVELSTTTMTEMGTYIVRGEKISSTRFYSASVRHTLRCRWMRISVRFRHFQWRKGSWTRLIDDDDDDDDDCDDDGVTTTVWRRWRRSIRSLNYLQNCQSRGSPPPPYTTCRGSQLSRMAKREKKKDREVRRNKKREIRKKRRRRVKK